MVLRTALMVDLCEGRYHVAQAPEGREGQTACGWAHHATEDRGGDGHEALETGAEADDTQRSEAGVRDDPEQGKGEAVQAVGRVGDLDHLTALFALLFRGLLLVGVLPAS